jgi:hypothetical protein
MFQFNKLYFIYKMHLHYNEASKYLGTSADAMFQPWDHNSACQYHKTEEEDSVNDIGSVFPYMLKQRSPFHTLSLAGSWPFHHEFKCVDCTICHFPLFYSHVLSGWIHIRFSSRSGMCNLFQYVVQVTTYKGRKQGYKNLQSATDEILHQILKVKWK